MGQRVDGYRGIWHGQESTGDAYHFKYSGGLATYTAKHIPIAVHAPAAGKTFFVYGGTRGEGRDRLLAMIGCFDHQTGRLERPVLIHDKSTFDPHDNAALAIDTAGHLWVFISGRGRQRPGWIYRSEEPYSIDRFRLMDSDEYTYPQPWHLEPRGFFFLFTKYLGGRQLFFKTSLDGEDWSEDRKLAAFGGHYQLSWSDGERVATTFNWHPRGDVDERTNLYYMETRDFGRSWQTADGRKVQVPLAGEDNTCLVHDYQADGKRVYLNDLKFDRAGNPVILYVVSDGWRPGPNNGPRKWKIARFDRTGWRRSEVCASDHNYDTGLLDVGEDRLRVIGPTETGPQAYHTGGEVAVWESRDDGQSWKMVRRLTSQSRYNHTYVRPVLGAHNDFFAIWADGDPAAMSPCRLYFCNRDATLLWRMPEQIQQPTAPPIALELP